MGIDWDKIELINLDYELNIQLIELGMIFANCDYIFFLIMETNI